MSLIYEGNFIVGGPPNTKVSPNFRLNELTRKNGTIKIHKELVSALQILRDRYSSSISVESMGPVGELGKDSAGLFAFLKTGDIDRLAGIATDMKQLGYFHTVTPIADNLYVDIGTPDSLPPIKAIDALQTAVQVTAGFETSGDPFQQVTGNFDGAGLSFGPSQVNFGTGTLVPLFRKFVASDEPTLLSCFNNEQLYKEWTNILNASKQKQIQWADQNTKNNSSFKQPWKSCLQAVGRVQLFRNIMTEHAVEKYGEKLSRALNWLRDQVDIEIDNLRCICSLYDLCTQQGSLNKAHSDILNRISAERPDDQFEVVHIAATERGKKANSPWRADCISRRLGILNRQKTFIRIGDESKARDNRFFYLLRNTNIENPEDLYNNTI